MRSELDRLMKAADLDALLVRGAAQHNAPMTYFTGLRHMSAGYLLKKVDQEPILYCRNMEREEAAASGYETHLLDDFNYTALLKEAEGDDNLVNAIILSRIFEKHGVRGRLAIYGKLASEAVWGTYKALEAQYKDIEIVAENPFENVISDARKTKDEGEIERIRAMGKITTAVVADVAGFLTSHEARGGVLVDRHGDPVLIGDLKKKIDLWLAMRGAANPKGVIFAPGRDAGIPHSAGRDDQPIPIGQPIVFDIFPCEAGGGYYYDFTRTWCLGFATEQVDRLYQDVLEVYENIYASLVADTPCRDYQIKTCELFNSRGHPTVLTDETTMDGYVHSLAHGIGLDVHEAPWFHHSDTNHDLLLPGSVITVEPGLYYPEQDMGVRIEDTVRITSDGKPETLVEYPKDLVLKVPGV